MNLYKFQGYWHRQLASGQASDYKNLNISDVYTRMIQEAGKCDNYASDILHDIEDLKERIEKMPVNGNDRMYIGYRDMGTDGNVYLECREDDYEENYRAIHEISISKDTHGYIRVTLYELKKAV